ncbi:MAG: Fic family protein [Bacilli bacterium]|nr:Fic family protein [Bacilli bacterium]
MKMFDLKGAVLGVSTPSTVSLLNYIEMYKGKSFGIEKMKKVEMLKDIARRSHVLASNAIGSVYADETRLEAIFKEEEQAETLQEHMIRGYDNALSLINEVYKFQPFDRSFISTLHYYIYKDYNPEFGGRFKDSQNYIQEALPDGTFRTIFVSAAPEEVLPLLDNLIYQFNECARDEECNKLVLIACFMLDFMCIHPYNHGNGRVSRLILDFLLKKFGYDIDEYFAIPYLMRQHIGEYIDAFEASSKGWSDNENNYGPFVTFILKRVLEAYRKLDYIMEVNNLECDTDEKVLKIVVDSATPIGKGVVVNVLYATSQATIEKSLSKLLKDGRIQLITKGRYSKYFRV